MKNKTEYKSQTLPNEGMQTIKTMKLLLRILWGFAIIVMVTMIVFWAGSEMFSRKNDDSAQVSIDALLITAGELGKNTVLANPNLGNTWLATDEQRTQTNEDSTSISSLIQQPEKRKEVYNKIAEQKIKNSSKTSDKPSAGFYIKPVPQ
ncbi:MAG: hypothetical protein QM727_03570 [Niabella sp.]